MKKNINKMLKDGFKLAKKYENLENEIMNSEATPKKLKDVMIKLKEELEQRKIENDNYMEENKHRIIVGYDENFNAIYE